MKTLFLLLFAPFAVGANAQEIHESPVYEFSGAAWFDGHAFRNTTFYSVHGHLTHERPARIDSVIDLSGGYVVPPFGEAHNHNVEPSRRLNDVIHRYLEAGIFYVKNPNNLPGTDEEIQGQINVPTSIEVIFSNGGITGSGGHPIGVARRAMSMGAFSEADGEGGFYHTVDNESDLARKWPEILAQDPDFIKVYLLYSDEYDRRKDDSTYLYWRGIAPALVPEIVRRAHEAGLRVSAHIETAADFRAALDAGVDEITHMPGFRGNERGELPDATPYLLTEADARRAVRQGTVVVTTVGGAASVDPAGEQGTLREALDTLHRRNLRLLHEQGACLVIGSDSYDESSLSEALYLHELGVFDNLTLLKMWSEATPSAIFPARRIGRLQEGSEASFIVLGGNPVEAFGNVKNVVLRMKEGWLLLSQ